MRRKEIMAAIQTQKHDASSIGNKRGMARRAKRQGAKRVRQLLRKEQETMKLQYPRAVRVRGYEYQIDYVDKCREVDHNLASTDLLGQCCPGNPGQMRILATQQGIGILDSVIHETLHAIFNRNAVLTAAIRPEIGDEAFISALANELAYLLVDNWVTLPETMKPTETRIN